MAAPPILLVADDLAVIAAVKRVLAREGYECVLATNAADAIIAWGHSLPGLVVIQPSVESDRGGVVLEELQQHPDAQLLRVVLLGETIPGFAYPVEPLPLDAEHFSRTIEENVRTAEPSAAWTVLETTPPEPEATETSPDTEQESWRATPPREGEEPPTGSEDVEVPEPQAVVAEPTPPLPPEAELAPPPEAALEDRLFGDMPGLEEEVHRDVEAQAMASVEASLAAPPVDDAELSRLEDEVRAEAQRRRQAREAKAAAAAEVDLAEPEVSFPSPPPAVAPAAEESFESLTAPEPGATPPEASFADLDEEAPQPSAAPPAHKSREKEVLERAEKLLLEGRAAAEQHRRADEEDAKQLAAELEAANRRVEHAEALVRKERESRAVLEEELAQLRDEAQRSAADQQKLQVELARAAEAVASLDAAVEERDARLGMLTKNLADTELAAQAEAEAARSLSAKVTQLEGRLGESQAAAKNAQIEAAVAKTLGEKLEAEEQAHAAVKQQFLAAQSRAEEAALQRNEALDRVATLEQRVQSLEADLGATTDSLDETARQRDEARAAITALEAALAERTGAVEKAAERVRELETRATMTLTLPGKKVLGVPRNETVDLEGLAQLVCQLVLSQEEVKAELGAQGGVRTLYFKRGSVIGAESSFDHEGLIDRARRDGLIDARQESELRVLRGATPREQLDALKSRGFIRDIESVPLVQRYTEQVALEAFTELTTRYRLIDEPPGPGVLLATVPRPTLPMLAESLRRAVPPDLLLEKLGGGESVPVATDSELDLRALGFSERERKMLTWVDGEATVEDLSLASGLKPDVAFRAMLVAKFLGAIAVEPPRKKAPVTAPELDVQRLESKYDEVQDADYFTILGLPRSAGGDDVQRAFQRLSSEFDPIRYSGHPDAGLQQRAQVVARLLEEAARALEDDRRRAEYARHLLD